MILSNKQGTQASAPLIPGSESLYDFYTQRLFVGSMISGDVQLIGTQVSYLNDPTNNQDSATKNYVNNTFRINKTQTIISENQDYTYTASEIIGGFIQRNMEGLNRTDKFPTATDIITTMQETNTSINFIECVIQNMSTVEENNHLTIDLFQTGITVISGDTTVTVGPYSMIIFRIIFTSDTTVDIYYLKSFIQNLSDNFYKYQNSYQINNIVKNSVSTQKTNPLTITTTGTYNATDIINSIITRTTTAGIDIFPTNTSIITALDPLATNLSDTWSFKTIIRNKTGSPLQISSNTGIIFDFAEPFYLGIENAVTFLIKYNGTSLNTFTVYILKITSFDNLCCIS